MYQHRNFVIGSLALAFAFTLALQVGTAQTVFWEGFEDPNFTLGTGSGDYATGTGWFDWTNGGAVFSLSSTGATVGSNALKWEPGAVGFYQGLAFKLQTLTGDPARRAAAWEGFLNNTHIAFEITWNIDDWSVVDPNDTVGGNNFSNIGLDINFGPGGTYQGQGVPDIDTGNPDFPGGWDRFNYSGVHTRTVMWDITEVRDAIQVLIDADPNNPPISATNGWVEFNFATNAGNNYEFPVAYYFDNFRFTSPNPADVDMDGDVDGVDFLIIQRTNPSLIPVWEAAYGTEGGPLQAAAAAVPEPASLVLLALGLGGIGASRWRRQEPDDCNATPGRENE